MLEYVAHVPRPTEAKKDPKGSSKSEDRIPRSNPGGQYSSPPYINIPVLREANLMTSRNSGELEPVPVVGRELPASGGRDTVQVGTFVAAFQKSIKSMDWLSDEDAAAIRLGYHYAAMLDSAEASGDMATIVKFANHGAYLKNLLNDLGGTPAARGVFTDKPVEADPMEDLLAGFQTKARKARGKKAGAA